MNLQDGRAGPMDLSLRTLTVGTAKLVLKTWDIGRAQRAGTQNSKSTYQTGISQVDNEVGCE